MGEMVSYPSDGGTCTGYLALPADARPADAGATDAGSGPRPGVVVIQEWWGLVSHIASVADRCAEFGYAALAPDLYRGTVTTEPDEAKRLLMGMAMDRAAQDIAGAVEYLASLPQVDENAPAGALGFCMGGSLALWSATFSSRIRLAVGFYPAVPWERMDPNWRDYTGKTAVVHCSEADGTSEAPGIQAARAGIEAAGGECLLYDYPGTKHAFFNDDNPEVYDAAASASAWARTVDAFRSRLG